jgi:hypothetical protein
MQNYIRGAAVFLTIFPTAQTSRARHHYGSAHIYTKNRKKKKSVAKSEVSQNANRPVFPDAGRFAV